jgi:hypothetical protein
MGHSSILVKNSPISYVEGLSPYLNSMICGISNGAIIFKSEGHTTANTMDPESISFPPLNLMMNLISKVLSFVLSITTPLHFMEESGALQAGSAVMPLLRSVAW